MRDVVVIGGGLSGLAACRELGRRQVSFTLIEVKARCGGSIQSRAENGFVTDGCAFAIETMRDAARLTELGLGDGAFAFDEFALGFSAGSDALINALSRGFSGGRLMRMALSSVGELGGRFTLCLENGMMLDAGALIIAAPARYASRMLRVLAPDAAAILFDFAYDHIRRVSLGYRKRDLAGLQSISPEFPFALSTDAPGRVPDPDHILLQIGARCSGDASDADVLQRLLRHFDLPAPLIAHIHRWDEADPMSCHDADHAATMAQIHGALPHGMFLIGSDYCLEAPRHAGIARIEERLHQGKSAAAAAADYIARR